jgi:DNA polymerase
VGRPAEERRAELVELYRQLHADHGCPLKAERAHLVFGMGNADADLMFVGEAPGRDEDLQGKPFVGRAGRLLDQLLEEIGIVRGDVFVANVLKCRPPNNRDPLPDEIAECKPHLMRQIALIEPKLICTLGNFATKAITGRPEGITRVCGRPQQHELGGLDVTVYPLLHPAAALRTPSSLNKLREDMAGIPPLLDELAPPEPVPVPAGPQETGETEPPPQLDLFG